MTNIDKQRYCIDCGKSLRSDGGIISNAWSRVRYPNGFPVTSPEDEEFLGYVCDDCSAAKKRVIYERISF